MDRKLSMKILMAAFGAIVIGCGIQYLIEPKAVSCEKQIFAMNTIMTFEAHGEKAEEAVGAVIEEMNRLDALLSTGNAESEISLVNAAGEGEVSEDAARILERAVNVYEQTDGAFDCTIYPLMKLWGFTSKEYYVPKEEEVEKVLGLVDSAEITVDGNYVILGEEQEIDLGGIAKGYASDRAIEIFREYGIDSGMVSLGGNVKTLNKNAEGNPWTIGIRNPEGGSEDVIAALKAENKAVVTSGGYERYFEENGETYIHIIDPSTGYPAEKGLVSVTIVSEDGMLADALSTALYIMGEEKAVEFWKVSEEVFEFVLITDTGEILATEGLEKDLTVKADCEIITR